MSVVEPVQQEEPPKPRQNSPARPKHGAPRAKSRDTLLGPLPFIPRRRHVVPESYKNHPSPPWAVEEEPTATPSRKRLTKVDKETSTDLPYCKCGDCTPKKDGEEIRGGNVIPIERTLSWECLEARRDAKGRGDACNYIPDYVVLPTDYFGKKKEPKMSTTKKHNALTKPFYPPGAMGATENPDRKSRITYARKMYQSPVIRKKVGTPAFYKKRQRPASEPRKQLRAFWVPMYRSRSETKFIYNSATNLIDHELDIMSREGGRANGQKDGSAEVFGKMDSFDGALIDAQLESLMEASTHNEKHGNLFVRITDLQKPVSLF